jgi:hypothetical protein
MVKTEARLMGMALVRELIESIILSGRVKGARPVSLLLIADPETGKTSIVLERQCEALIALTDTTGKGIHWACKLNPKMTHLVLTDMVAVMAHGKKVNQYTLSMINALTEEGILSVASPDGIEKFDKGRRGVIGCLTIGLAHDQRMWWHKTGLATRMLPFCYSYPDKLTVHIKAAIVNGNSPETLKDDILKVPDLPVAVTVPPPFPQKILSISDRFAKREGEKGIRRARQMRALAQGHAIRRGWKNAVVNQEDIQFLLKIEPYLSYKEARELELKKEDLAYIKEQIA